MTISTLDQEVFEYPTNPQNAEAIKAQNDEIVAAANLGTIAAGALTADAGGRAVMATGYFTEAKATDAFAVGAITAGLMKAASVETAALAAGVLSADVAGRAKMATGYFTEAKATDAFATAAITGLLLKAGALAATTQGRALMATGFFTEAKATDAFAAGAIDGSTLLKDASVPCAKLATSVRSEPQALSGPGAINLTTATTLFTSTGAGNALTLADGTVAGQRKRIIHHVKGASGTGVLTAGASLHLGASLASITLTNARDWVELEWSVVGTVWNVVGYAGASFA